MKKVWIWVLGILGIVLIFFLLIVGYVVGQYNNMVTLREGIDGAWAQVDNQLQRRNDLIPNLVNSVKGYMKQEREIFANIADARARMAGAREIPDRIDAARQMDTVLGRLFAIMENYPVLKSDQTVIRLMDELAGTENRIATERRRYNEAVRFYNTAIQRFPTRVFASIFGFEKGTYYEIEESARQVPEVNL
ncbi:MAG: LemA family protein [bacterium]